MIIIESIYMTTPEERIVTRTWKERLFSRPWRPLQPTKTVTVQVPREDLITIDGGKTFVGHPETVAKFREELAGYKAARVFEDEAVIFDQYLRPEPPSDLNTGWVRMPNFMRDDDDELD